MLLEKISHLICYTIKVVSRNVYTQTNTKQIQQVVFVCVYKITTIKGKEIMNLKEGVVGKRGRGNDPIISLLNLIKNKINHREKNIKPKM